MTLLAIPWHTYHFASISTASPNTVLSVQWTSYLSSLFEYRLFVWTDYTHSSALYCVSCSEFHCVRLKAVLAWLYSVTIHRKSRLFKALHSRCMHDCIEMSVLWVNSDVSWPFCVQSTVRRAVHRILACLIVSSFQMLLLLAAQGWLSTNIFGVFASLELTAHCSCTWVYVYILLRTVVQQMVSKLPLEANMRRRLEAQWSCSRFTLYVLLQLNLRQAESLWSDSLLVVLVGCHC
jgi:hypothetical protein